ncbi:glycosyl transferase group 1 [Thalassoporum mexicanum PCC 7367]|uniref:glycosyltransferase n=1 Tax=Thalassoporum mexicanum TaxID=3457544 RepID=UPI00029F98F5|nr:glycosyltransferase [Pseudanabaena sp. PCC 7367]AFY70261.1 glycosyl transferase group 1 [Pseudanabaena sp. PCC 7367]
MRKVAIFTETFLPKVDGIVTRLKHTVENLVKLGDEVMIFAPDGGLTEYCGAKIYGVSGFPLPMYPELKLALPRPSIGYALEQFQPDIVHLINPAVLGLAGLFYAKSMKLPLIASYHTHLPQYLQHYGLGFLENAMWELIKTAHNNAELNLCTSNAMVEQLREHGVKEVDLWQRGVDTELFHPQYKHAEMRSRLTEGHPEATLLLYVGRLSAEKGIDEILPVLQAIPNSRLALVGDGPYRQELEKIFAGTNTNFVGYLQGTDLASAFASSDVFLFPSRTETLGLVLLEAMAAGCPVVAANSGGIPDIVTNGLNGYMFDPIAEDGLLTATQQLLDCSPAIADDLKHNARLEAEKWGWEAATSQLQNYYDKVIEVSKASIAV